MKKLFAVLGLFLMVMTALVGMSTSANAALDGKWKTSYECVYYQAVETCVQVSWSKQADGTGVRLEGFKVVTGTGCSNLEGGNDAYGEVRPFWVNPANENIDYSYDFGKEPCYFEKDLSNAGRDGGGMDFRFNAKQRRDFAADRKVYIGWTLKPSGAYTVNYAFHAAP